MTSYIFLYKYYSLWSNLTYGQDAGANRMLLATITVVPKVPHSFSDKGRYSFKDRHLLRPCMCLNFIARNNPVKSFFRYSKKQHNNHSFIEQYTVKYPCILYICSAMFVPMVEVGILAAQSNHTEFPQSRDWLD